jgi:hypothetical protein
METLLGIATIVGVLLAFGILSIAFGADSREGLRDDWARSLGSR